MAHVTFPEHVETFIEATIRHLDSYDIELEEIAQSQQSEARRYRISAHGDEPVEVFVHRTSGSSKQPVGEYRARMYAVIRPEFAALLRGREGQMNRFATLGSLIATEANTSVACQCLIQPGSQDTLAGVFAAAAVQARPSMLVSLLRVLGEERPPVVEQPSAWTDPDFEQIQHDCPELGIGRMNVRGWAIPLHPYGVVSLTPVDDHPYWGGALLCQGHILERTLAPDGPEIDVNAMNLCANLADDTPTFGGWWRHDDLLLFTQFIPNYLKDLPGITHRLIVWAGGRLVSAPELVELVRGTAEQHEDD